LFWSTCKAKSKKSTKLFATCFMLVSCLAYSLTQKMEVTCSSETSVDFQQATWHYIPADRTLHNHCCENLISYNSLIPSTSSLCTFNTISLFPYWHTVTMLWKPFATLTDINSIRHRSRTNSRSLLN
jgi:hypothetical protein